MDAVRVGRVFRAIRIRMGLRQVDVAVRAGVSSSVVWRIEHGRLDEVSLAALLATAAALEIHLDLVARWRGGELDRVLSAAHSAFGESVAALLVIELKTEIVDVGELLGRLDVKRRNASRVAEEFGWRPVRVAGALLVTDTRTNRRRAATHEQTFRAALPDDTRAFRRWLRAPTRSLAAVAFLPDPRHTSLRQAPATRKRVRARPPTT